MERERKRFKTDLAETAVNMEKNEEMDVKDPDMDDMEAGEYLIALMHSAPAGGGFPVQAGSFSAGNSRSCSGGTSKAEIQDKKAKGRDTYAATWRNLVGRGSRTKGYPMTDYAKAITGLVGPPPKPPPEGVPRRKLKACPLHSRLHLRCPADCTGRFELRRTKITDAEGNIVHKNPLKKNKKSDSDLRKNQKSKASSKAKTPRKVKNATTARPAMPPALGDFAQVLQHLPSPSDVKLKPGSFNPGISSPAGMTNNISNSTRLPLPAFSPVAMPPALIRSDSTLFSIGTSVMPPAVSATSLMGKYIDPSSTPRASTSSCSSVARSSALNSLAKQASRCPFGGGFPPLGVGTYHPFNSTVVPSGLGFGPPVGSPLNSPPMVFQSSPVVSSKHHDSSGPTSPAGTFSSENSSPVCNLKIPSSKETPAASDAANS